MLAASAEKGSEHPLGEAIIAAAAQRGLTLEDVQGFNAIPGRGIEARVNGTHVTLGNLALMQERNYGLNGLEARATELSTQGKTPMFIALGDQVGGVIAVADTLKPEALDVVQSLHAMGREVIMLTGDNRRTAEAIARDLGIDRVLAEVLPEEQGYATVSSPEGRSDSPPSILFISSYIDLGYRPHSLTRCHRGSPGGTAPDPQKRRSSY